MPQRGPHLPEGLALFRNSDQQRQREASEAMRAVPIPEAGQSGLPLDITIYAQVGQPLTLIGHCVDGRHLEVMSEQILEPASGMAATPDRLAGALGTLGGSSFVLGLVEWELSENVFVPAGLLKRTRRDLLEQLDQQAVSSVAYDLPAAVHEVKLENHNNGFNEPHKQTKLRIAVSSLAAALAADAAGADQIWLEHLSQAEEQLVCKLFQTERYQRLAGNDFLL